MVKLRGLRERLVQPFLLTNAPVDELAWGAAMGMLTALLPFFGIQMYVATGLWALARLIFGRTFSMPVCFAVSWVMNPLTVVPIYYLYYVTGDTIWDWVMVPTPDWSFSQFEDLFIAAVRPSGGEWWERVFGGIAVLLQYFGWPIVLGSVLWATPLTVAAYVTTRSSVLRNRRRVAETSQPAKDPAATSAETV